MVKFVTVHRSFKSTIDNHFQELEAKLHQLVALKKVREGSDPSQCKTKEVAIGVDPERIFNE